MTTDRQKSAVRFCEKWTGVKFLGNIENYQSVSYFIAQHIDKAKEKSRLSMMDYIFIGKTY